ncbi:Uncharacterised protein [Moraxella ovis]|uniref:Uncharacterized protein n=1 Tax=Moraxella ovis TaxID=29433 RepID=A0A378PQ00_9GAMM|nr:hypothetical protein [Moraxella ovis]SPX85201.1 Uncharacterised protein [Moraxella ovis]STY86999.1 Uncharacterised protein [Moraxella ovis]STZ05101.1 Uncharacterised protein [Moraxella ovis]
MLVINNKMAKLLGDHIIDIDKFDIDKKLNEFLSLEFEKKLGGVFFHGAYTSQYEEKTISQEYIKKAYTDMSGMEISLNMIYIEDYVDSNILIQSIVFLRKFIDRWALLEDSEFLAVISFQDDDVGTFSKFSFHKIRAGEMIYDINKIDEFFDAAMIYISDISAFKSNPHLQKR